MGTWRAPGRADARRIARRAARRIARRAARRIAARRQGVSVYAGVPIAASLRDALVMATRKRVEIPSIARAAAVAAGAARRGGLRWQRQRVRRAAQVLKSLDRQRVGEDLLVLPRQQSQLRPLSTAGGGSAGAILLLVSLRARSTSAQLSHRRPLCVNACCELV